MTDDGLRTPAVERIVRSRRTPPPRHVAFAPAPAAGSSPVVRRDERVRPLRDALRAGSVPAVAALCQEHDAGPQSIDEGGELAAALEDGRAFRQRVRGLTAAAPAWAEPADRAGGP
ncbi:hypothetical protein ACH41H_48405 [Streptomyces sp. NPDC020800]|uniref:hypothetical protein n=1 Tax=Streptomyces sp. NPDC020800 TaxID=3365092 RepID=UPI0037A64688